MTVKQQRSKRKFTGGKLSKHGKITRHELGRDYVPAKLGDEQKVRSIRTMGGNKKMMVLSAKYVNVFADGKPKKVEIKNVIENSANPHFVRRNIITKGSVVETEIGKVIITSRPGQDGVVNGKLIQ